MNQKDFIKSLYLIFIKNIQILKTTLDFYPEFDKNQE